MNTITQKMINNAKNYILDQLKNKIRDLTDDILENIFYNYDESKNVFIPLKADINTLALDIIKQSIEFIDTTYRDSEERIIYYNINTRYDERSIMTIFGELIFKRTYYEDKNRENHFYLIDSLFNFPKYSRYDDSTKAIALDLAIKTNQKKGGEIYGNSVNPFSENNKYSVCRQTIYKWLKNWNTPIVEYEPKETEDILYLMIDEKYIHEQQHIDEKDTSETKSTKEIKDEVTKQNTKEKKKKHHIMSKCFVAFTGSSKVGNDKNRRQLNNKFIFLTASKKPWIEFINVISKIYDFKKIKIIKTLSDAGTWITAGFNELKLYENNKVLNCLCDFHVQQTIHRITKNDDYRIKLKEYAIEGNKKGFLDLIEIIKEDKDENRKNKIDKYTNYIVKRLKWIKNMRESDCKSSMESHISHNVANYFSSRPKAYSSNTIEKLLKLNEYHANGIDISKLFLQSCRNEIVEKYTENSINLSAFENNSRSNMPILSNGKLNTLYSTLYSIAHT